jgi:hypothetical protein
MLLREQIKAQESIYAMPSLMTQQVLNWGFFNRIKNDT